LGTKKEEDFDGYGDDDDDDDVDEKSVSLFELLVYSFLYFAFEIIVKELKNNIPVFST
jgi:hypothetical protein